MFIGYTDASANVIGSVHSYILYNEANKEVIDIGLKNWNVQYNMILVEAYSLTLLATVIEEMNIHGGIIYTDNKALENIIGTEVFYKREQDPEYMHEEVHKTIKILKSHGFKVEHISRRFNLMADKLCSIVKPKRTSKRRLRENKELNRFKWIGQSTQENSHLISIIAEKHGNGELVSIRTYGKGVEMRDEKVLLEENWKNRCKDILKSDGYSIKVPFNDLVFSTDKLLQIIESIYELRLKAEAYKYYDNEEKLS